MSTIPPPRPPGSNDRTQTWLRLLGVVVLLFIFLVGIRGLGTGFKGLGKGALDAFFAATSNPFVALSVGILATTLVQSSSVTTSMVVALVAAPENPLPIATAIPMIMGANIGTTVTNTIVSLGHVGRPAEFQRAFAAATCHDFFNFISVAIFLPLELATGFLTKFSYHLSQMIGVGGSGKPPNPLKKATKAALAPLQDGIGALSSSKQIAAVLLIIASGVIIFGTLLLIVRLLRQVAAARTQTFLTRALDASPYLAIVVGVIVTVMVQSSSITTSVLVPLAGAGIVTVRQIFPVTLGANIGTTVTAILASMAAPTETAQLAVQVAAVHLLFNLAGTLMIFPSKRLREIPVQLAERLARTAVKSRKLALVYVAGLFYGLPALLVFATR